MQLVENVTLTLKTLKLMHTAESCNSHLVRKNYYIKSEITAES